MKICTWVLLMGLAGLLSVFPTLGQSDNFPVPIYTADNPPPTPALTDLLLTNQISQQGITWTFTLPARVGRFVNGDYYVVGPVIISAITPVATPANGRNGSMINIRPNLQRSGFDDREQADRYDASLRVYPPITLLPGNKLISSRSIGTSYLPFVMRPYETSESPVASISILTCVAAPLPPDAFRPSYALNSTNIYLSRNLRRDLLPSLKPVQHIPPLSEFEGYLKRPWVDSVYYNFDTPSEYMPSYGREEGYLISFAGLLLTLNFTPEQKEPLLVYLTQYGIDIFGLVEQGHTGWKAQGGYGSGRKFPILFAGVMLDQAKLRSVSAQFGEDMQTIWVSETLPAGTYTQSWHTKPETAVFGGHAGLNGESMGAGWGPYEHLPPSQWKNTTGESYRRCCTSVCWIGEALAARLIPGMQTAWNHPQFFAYTDRWMFSPDLPADNTRMLNEAGFSWNPDIAQGQTARVLTSGGYQQPHATFVDEMWKAYRNIPQITSVGVLPGNKFTLTVQNAAPNKTNIIQATTNVASPTWVNVSTNITTTNPYIYQENMATNRPQRFYRVKQSP